MGFFLNGSAVSGTPMFDLVGSRIYIEVHIKEWGPHSDADHVKSTPSYLALSEARRTASVADEAYTIARQSSIKRPKNGMYGSS